MILRSAARDSTLQPLIQHLIKMGAAPFLVNMAEAILARVQMYKIKEAPHDQAHLPILERTFLVCHHTVSFEASFDADLEEATHDAVSPASVIPEAQQVSTVRFVQRQQKRRIICQSNSVRYYNTYIPLCEAFILI